MTLRDHPLRAELLNEIHARPPEALEAPLRLSYIALIAAPEARASEWHHFCALLTRFGLTPPDEIVNHISRDLGPFRVKFERHGEFARYKFIAPGGDGAPFSTPALSLVPADWLAELGGEVIAATHVELRRATPYTAYEELAAELFDGNAIVGSELGGGAALAITDFRIGADGFGRLLVLDRSLTRRQAGRMVQRLLEMDTYRMMALLALPVARELAPFLGDCERALAQITAELPDALERDEPALLDRLTRLEASIEHRIAGNDYRFGAAAAYYELVKRRIEELRETRIQGLPTFQEFNERRLGPAMSTCRTMAARQESLSARVARANELLATRVDISRELQSQALLASMDRRASMQLRLQQTVEGLSVAAFTYYVVGLVGYGAKGLKAAGIHLEPELVMGLSVPLIAAVAAVGMHRIRRMVSHGSS